MTAEPTAFSAADFEKLGAFYLGRRHDLASGENTPEIILYDASDLTTHAVCVGMTGSGKTGLCTCLLEEALLDGVPAIAVDVKGDLSNLLLGFPELRPTDFEPWVDPAEAERKGMTTAEFAASTAEVWRKGLADWGEDGARIQRMQDACEMRIFTPGSDAGLPLSILKSFDAPPEQALGDKDALRERLVCVVGGLLGLLGIEADPLKSREHILLSTILGEAWEKGEGTTLPGLIQAIQKPPFTKVGVFELDVFYPPKERLELAMALNNLLASPTFAAWLEGEPLDVGSMLWGPGGKPRLSILYIAHLSEQERMFFVSLLLNEVLSWVRAQSGTSSLRAILYMDEIFGYFPPVANPPTKPPMLSLLKQARAFGLGVVLATQNPVDLDYKGLSNTGTWLIGRLQTERDKARVLEGLEGASVTAGASFDHNKMDETLAGLGKRVFLMHNVHENAPVIFGTRWAMSYLRGPMTRDQVHKLMEPQLAKREVKSATEASVTAETAPTPAQLTAESAVAEAPAAEHNVPQLFVPQLAGQGKITYSPVLTAHARLHFTDSRLGLDEWRTLALQGRLDAGSDPWESAIKLRAPYPEAAGPAEGAEFADAGREALQEKNYSAWGKMLASHLYNTERYEILKCRQLKLTSEPGETGDQFAQRVIQVAREARDEDMAKLREDYARKEQRLRDSIDRAERAVAEEQADYASSKVQSVFDIGATVLGSILGRKGVSMSDLERARTAGHSVGRTSKRRGDVKRAREKLANTQVKLNELELELQRKLSQLRQKWDPAGLDVTSKELSPRKSDIDISGPFLTWLPHIAGEDGKLKPDYRQP